MIDLSKYRDKAKTYYFNPETGTCDMDDEDMTILRETIVHLLLQTWDEKVGAEILTTINSALRQLHEQMFHAYLVQVTEIRWDASTGFVGMIFDSVVPQRH